MDSFIEKFSNPPKEYSLAPFWFWNDDLNPEHLTWQLNEMKDKGVYECVVHARKGLEVEYLSDTWFNRVGVVLEHAEKIGMKIWLYDENNWPSGFANGKVIEYDSDLCGKCISREKIYPQIGVPIKVEEIRGTKVIGVIASFKNEEFYDITEQRNEWYSETLRWEVFVFRQRDISYAPAYSVIPYIDVLNRRAVDKFIELTHVEYKKRFSNYFGTTLKGFFTDEPGLYQNYISQAKNLDTIPWTPEYRSFFMKKKGYDILLYLGALWEDMGDLSLKTRVDFYEIIAEMYMENYFKPLYQFCEENQLQSIGHVPQEESFKTVVEQSAHFFQTMRYLHVPGIDLIDRTRYRVTEKLGSSASHLFDRERCFSESYGCFGWELTLEEMKSWADWQMVQGVNMLIPHAFFSSIEGIRVMECPPSEFYQNPYWKHFKIFADYISRVCFATTQGKPSAPALVYYPITSAWEGYEPSNHKKIYGLDDSFIDLSISLLQNQVDFDYVDDFGIIERATFNNSKIIINDSIYKVVIVPQILNMPVETLKFFSRFIENGGILISIKGIPIKSTLKSEDPESASLLQKLKNSPNYYVLKNEDASEIKDLLSDKKLLDIKLNRRNSNIKYLKRQTEQGSIYFIINESAEPVEHSLDIFESSDIVKLDPITGKTVPVAANIYEEHLNLKLSLDAYGSCILVTKNTPVCHTIDLTNAFKIKFSNGKTSEKLLDWSEIYDSQYSGYVDYLTQFKLEDKFEKIILNLGEVKDCAEIHVNDVFINALLWEPYTIDITDFVQLGENKLKISVCNSITNQITDTKTKSGLFGPVTISCI